MSATLQLDGESIRPLLATIVREVLSQIDAAEARIPGGRLAYTEAEAAGLLGLNSWQLRDERLRGRISAGRGPGRKLMYSREDLLGYLRRGREAT